MNFKDQLQKDLSNVFFNVNEFAQEVIVNGSIIRAVPDEHELQEYNLKAEGEELTRGELLFYAPVSDFIEEPFRGMDIHVNRKAYRILEIGEDAGMYRIILEGHQS